MEDTQAIDQPPVQQPPVSKSEKLYQNLIKSGFTEGNLGKKDEFQKALENPISANKIYSHLRDAGLTEKNLGTLKEFQTSFSPEKKSPDGTGLQHSDSSNGLSGSPNGLNPSQSTDPHQQVIQRALSKPKPVQQDKKEDEGITDKISNALYLPAFNEGVNDLLVKPFLGAGDFVGRTTDKLYRAVTGANKTPEWLYSNKGDVITNLSKNLDQAYQGRAKPKNIVSETAEGAIGSVPLVASLFTGEGELSLASKAPQLVSKATKLLATTTALKSYHEATKAGKGYLSSAKEAVKGGEEGAEQGLTLDAQMLLGGALGKGVVNKVVEKGLLKGGKAAVALLHALSTATIFGGTPAVQDLLAGKDIDTHEAVKNFGVGLMFETMPVAKGLHDEISDKVEEKKQNTQAAQTAVMATAASHLHSESVLQTLVGHDKSQLQAINENVPAGHEDLYAQSIEQGMKAYESKNPNEKRDLLANQLLLKTQGDVKFIASHDNKELLDAVVNSPELEPAEKANLIDKISTLSKNEQAEPNTEIPAQQPEDEGGQAEKAINPTDEATKNNKVADNYPYPKKPLEDMNSDELNDHAKEIKQHLKDQEKEFFGEDGAKEYNQAQAVSNSTFSSYDKRKEADATIAKYEKSLTPEQSKAFFGENGNENQHDPAEIRDIATKVNFIENSKNSDELAGSIKKPLMDFKADAKDSEAKILLKAAARKAGELGIDPKEMLKKGIEKIVADLPGEKGQDLDGDKEVLIKSILSELAKTSEKVSDNQKQIENSPQITTNPKSNEKGSETSEKRNEEAAVTEKSSESQPLQKEVSNSVVPDNAPELAKTVIDKLNNFGKANEHPHPEKSKWFGKSSYDSTNENGYKISISPTKEGHMVALGRPGKDVGNVDTFNEIKTWFPESDQELKSAIDEADKIANKITTFKAENLAPEEHSEANDLLQSEYGIDINDYEQSQRDQSGEDVPPASTDAKSAQQAANDGTGNDGEHRPGESDKRSKSTFKKPQKSSLNEAETDTDGVKSAYGTKNAITEELQQGTGLPPIEIPKDRTDDESLAAWKDGTRTPQEIVEGLLSPDKNIYDKSITPNDEPIMREYIRQLGERGRELNKIKIHLQEKADAGDKQAEMDVASVSQQINRHLDEYNDALNASKVGGNIWHKYGDERQKAIDDKGLILNAIDRINNIYGKDIPADIKNQLKELQAKHDELVAKNEVLEQKIKDGAVKENFEKVKSKTILGTKKLSEEEFKTAKKDILADLKKDWKKSFASTYATLPGVPQFNALAPHIGKLMKLYAERGISKIDDVINHIHNDLKDDLDGITKEDIKDIIAGRYSSKKPLSDLQKQVNQLRTQARNQVKIEDLEKGISAKTKAKGETSPEVKELQKQLADLKKQSLNQFAHLSADELKKQAVTIQRQIDKGDFFKAPFVKRKWETDPEWIKNNKEKADLMFKLRKMEQEAMNSKKGKLMRTLDWTNRWGRRVIFFGANAVYTKLSSAAVLGSFVHRLPEQMLGAMNAKMFPNIARNAPVEGSLNLKSEMQWYLDFVNPKEFTIDAKDIILTGETRLSKSMDTHPPGLHIPIVDLFAADGHQILKSSDKRATFNAAFAYQMDWYEKNGVDNTHPAIIESARQAAWQRANYEVFQDSPKNQTKIKEYFNQLERSGILNRNKPDGWSKIQGNAQYSAAALYHFFIPINTVPVNILKRVGLGLKLPATYLEAISKNKSVRDGILKMTNEESDAILVQLKKGQIMAAYWTLGFVLGGSMAGGMYTSMYPDKERDKDAVTPDADYLNFRGLDVPKNAQHNTQFQSLQMGATWRMVHDHYVDDKGESQLMSIFAASAATAGVAAKEHPVISTASNLLDAVKSPSGNTKWVKDLRRRIGVQKAQDVFKLMGYDIGDDSEDYSTKKKP